MIRNSPPEGRPIERRRFQISIRGEKAAELKRTKEKGAGETDGGVHAPKCGVAHKGGLKFERGRVHEELQGYLSRGDEQLKVSVIIEGDNEKHCPKSDDGPVCLGLAGLAEQEYPLEQIDLLLVGNTTQIDEWRRGIAAMPFGRVRTIAADGVDYFEMKQRGALEAVCPILAFLDSDVKPRRTWLRSLVDSIETGYDISVGVTRLEWHGRCGPDSGLMLAFGSISWGAIISSSGVSGFHANNVGLRSEVLDAGQYRKGMLRTCAAQELFNSLRQAGKRAIFRNEQCVVHAFSLEWWAEMHGRSGRESILLRRMFRDWPHQWVRNTGPLEPLLTALWRIAQDPGQWWRYAGAVNISRARRVLLFPLLLTVSVATRGTEMIGGYAGMLDGSLAREMPMHLSGKP